MAIFKIARLGHPVIRHGAAPVAREDLCAAETQKFIDDLVETMRDAMGVGIAAPQVHVLKQLIAIEVSPHNPRYPNQSQIPLTIVANPTIVEHSEETENGWEGCLSVPDLRGMVPRWTRVKVHGLDRQGRTVRIESEGFLARVLQHEIDHLNGQVFLDRLPDLRTLTHLREYEKYWIHS